MSVDLQSERASGDAVGVTMSADGRTSRGQRALLHLHSRRPGTERGGAGRGEGGRREIIVTEFPSDERAREGEEGEQCSGPPCMTSP